MRVNGSAPRMCDEDWLFRSLDRFRRGAIAAVAEIDSDTQLVHPLHCALTCFAKTRVARLQTSIAENAPIVIGKMHDADAQPPKNLNARGIGLKEAGVLKARHDAQLALALGAGDVCMNSNHGDHVRPLLDHRTNI